MAPRKLPRSKLKRTARFYRDNAKPEQRKTQPTENVTKNLRISPTGWHSEKHVGKRGLTAKAVRIFTH